MFDINAIVNAAINAAVQQATAPLVERIAALESQVNGSAFATSIEQEVLANFEMADVVGAAQLDALEGVARALAQHNQSLITALEERIAGLETRAAAAEAQLMAARERIAALENNPAQGQDLTATADITQCIIAALNDTESPLFQRVSSFMDTVVEQAMDDHTSTYDHDDYDSHISDDDKHIDGGLDDAVRDALSGMTFEVSVS